MQYQLRDTLYAILAGPYQLGWNDQAMETVAYTGQRDQLIP